VIVAVGSALVVTTQLPVEAKHFQDPVTCTVAMGAVNVSGQQSLAVNAWALTPNTTYLEAQAGVQSVMVTTDATGSVSDQSLLYQGPGTYTVEFDFYYFHNSQLVQVTATHCSATL
jgi:hypothetical protein